MNPNQKSHAVRSAAQCANNADIRHHPCVWLIFEDVYFERLIIYRFVVICRVV